MAKLQRIPLGRKPEEPKIELPERVSIELGALAGKVKEGLLAFAVGVGLEVFATLLEEDATGIAGPKGRHHPEDRVAYRHGEEASKVVLGGRKIPLARPRLRGVAGGEIILPTWAAFASEGLLSDQTMASVLAGVSCPGLDREGNKHLRFAGPSSIGPGRRRIRPWLSRPSRRWRAGLIPTTPVRRARCERGWKTLTVARLGLPPSLLRTLSSTNPIELSSTNPIESAFSVARTTMRNVKRWRSGQMALRWSAAGMEVAAEKFRRVKGYREMPILVDKLGTHVAELSAERGKVA